MKLSVPLPLSGDPFRVQLNPQSVCDFNKTASLFSHHFYLYGDSTFSLNLSGVLVPTWAFKMHKTGKIIPLYFQKGGGVSCSSGS